MSHTIEDIIDFIWNMRSPSDTDFEFKMIKNKRQCLNHKMIEDVSLQADDNHLSQEIPLTYSTVDISSLSSCNQINPLKMTAEKSKALNADNNVFPSKTILKNLTVDSTHVLSAPLVLPPVSWKCPSLIEVNLLNTLQELEIYAASLPCSLKYMAQHMVFSDGLGSERILMIGEAPGSEEDKQGKPFVGASGQLLNKILKALNWTRDHVRIINVCLWRPPFNRPPTSEEIALCFPILVRQIQLFQPRCLVLLGATAYKAVTGLNTPMHEVRGKWFSWPLPSKEDSLETKTLETIPAYTVFHPSYLLRSPRQKKIAWEDWLFFYKTYPRN
jgi:DNA polymerase